MTFTEYRNVILHPIEYAESVRRQRRLERLTYIVAVVVGMAGAVLLGAALSGCGGSTLDYGRGVHCTAPPDSGIIPTVCERIDEREMCCP